METCRAQVGEVYCGAQATGEVSAGPITLYADAVSIVIPLCDTHLGMIARGRFSMPICSDCKFRLKGDT